MIQIIPAIDLLSGRCVRLTEGDYATSKCYDEDPVNVARRFEAAGCKMLHLVDLEGARSARPCQLRWLEKIATATSLKIEFGGGVRDETAVSDALNAGAESVICGSVAVLCPEQFGAWIERFGASKIVLGADVRAGRVSVNGWLEERNISVEKLVRHYEKRGIQRVICTDIARDGKLCGVDTTFYAKLMQKFPAIQFTVSGGVSSVDDLEAIERAGIPSVIVGKALYEGKINLETLAQWWQNA